MFKKCVMSENDIVTVVIRKITSTGFPFDLNSKKFRN